MGLGLNGGGAAAARFLAESGADVIATDLRDETILRPTLESLKDLNIEYRLGEHLIEDFEQSDLVIKNPAVKKDSPYLQVAKRIETDLTLFLRFSDNPILAVTGSKGKSTTVSALYQILRESGYEAYLGGNITVSPLSFFEKTSEAPEAPVVLELSSWQLADIAWIEDCSQEIILKPEISMISNIMHDHQNAYNSFEEYVNDKRVIYRNQDENQILICRDDQWGRSFASETKAKTIFISEKKLTGEECAYLEEDDGGWIQSRGLEDQILSDILSIKGNHNRINLLQASAAAWCFGCDAREIIESGQRFQGIPYRMEPVAEGQIGSTRVQWINDSAATMPDAMIASSSSFSEPVYLICGGTDKELDFSPCSTLSANVRQLFLLQGSATEKMEPLLPQHLKNQTPFTSLEASVDAALKAILRDAPEEAVILLSPGAASFGMFINEFDRGDQFTALAQDRQDCC